ncbi:protein of unknown function [Nitrospira japonica]|uniref:Uncharacterized protein n=1 Tax=Nitrospira japonica TaxID=1325564 RepID=A0A1W1I5Q0_9BACT|nr:protein of unknown function [Nitrospira japonica]
MPDDRGGHGAQNTGMDLARSRTEQQPPGRYELTSDHPITPTSIGERQYSEVPKSEAMGNMLTRTRLITIPRGFEVKNCHVIVTSRWTLSRIPLFRILFRPRSPTPRPGGAPRTFLLP